MQKYYETFDKWPHPDFSKGCILCGAADCATYHGHYTRIAICAETGFSEHDFPVMRFLCHGKGDKKCHHVTFSLLPIGLVPFRQLTLKFMVLAVWIRLSKKTSLTKTLDYIEEELNNFSDIADFINISTLMSWERLVRSAFDLFLSLNFNNSFDFQHKEISADEKGLLVFIEALITHKSSIKNNPIRGPDSFAWEFYQQSGGATQLALFLFGRASQH